MALLGTLAEFHVDDVLVLLAGTKKTGVLAVEGAGRAGRLWVDGGHIVGAELADHHEASDVVFELLRLVDGKFAYEAGVMPDSLGAPQDVQQVLASARTKLAEWRDIERVIPSQTSMVALNPDAGVAGPISIGADDWRTVAAIGAGGTVAEIGGRLGMVEFAAGKALKAVVDAGLAAVTPVAAGEATPAAFASSSRPDDLVRQLSELRQG